MDREKKKSKSRVIGKKDNLIKNLDGQDLINEIRASNTRLDNIYNALRDKTIEVNQKRGFVSSLWVLLFGSFSLVLCFGLLKKYSLNGFISFGVFGIVFTLFVMIAYYSNQ